MILLFSINKILFKSVSNKTLLECKMKDPNWQVILLRTITFPHEYRTKGYESVAICRLYAHIDFYFPNNLLLVKL